MSDESEMSEDDVVMAPGSRRNGAPSARPGANRRVLDDEDEGESSTTSSRRKPSRKQTPDEQPEEEEEEDDDDDDAVLQPHQKGSTSSSGHGTRSVSGSRKPSASPQGAAAPEGRRKKKSRAAWEDVKRSWDTVVEGADGQLPMAEVLEAAKRKRCLMRETTPLQRGIIRHVMLVLDMSFAMAEKDMLPTRHRLVLGYAAAFVREFFEQNPISQLGILGMRDGVALRISELSGDLADHLEKLRALDRQDPQGNPSLQNALEMCRGALFNTPRHGTREVVIVYGALLSSDPGDIQDTISHLLRDRIRVSIIGLAAQVAICAEICRRTNGGDDTSQYNVALDEQHLRDLLMASTTPPVARKAKGVDPAKDQTTAAEEKESIQSQDDGGSSLLFMGFPSRRLALDDASAYCACHNELCREGYLCTRCGARVCRLPAECPACGLMLILSTHLARSYHHLFPLPNYVEVPWSEASASRACLSCHAPFPPVPSAYAQGPRGPDQPAILVNGNPPTEAAKTTARKKTTPPESKGVSESGRYGCARCHGHFCIDCDVYAHEVIHNCPGCQSRVS